MAKRIASAGIVALKEELTNVYWYKSDLRSFLASTLANPAVLGNLNWSDYIVSTMVDFMARREEQYQSDLVRLMSEVSRVGDFSHLERLGAEQPTRTPRELTGNTS